MRDARARHRRDLHEVVHVAVEGALEGGGDGHERAVRRGRRADLAAERHGGDQAVDVVPDDVEPRRQI